MSHGRHASGAGRHRRPRFGRATKASARAVTTASSGVATTGGSPASAMSADGGATAGGDELTPRQILTAMSGLVIAMLLAQLDNMIVAPALPTIVGDLGGLEHLSWVVTGYILASTRGDAAVGQAR